MTTGYIYVIKNEVGGLGGFKIGQTINPPRRFRELKLGTKSSLVGLWRSDKYASIERFLHKTFKHLRVPQSEWFALTPNVLQDVIGKLNRCSTCLKLESEYRPAQTAVFTTDVTVPTLKLEQPKELLTYKPKPVNFLVGLLLGIMPGWNIAAGLTIINRPGFKTSFIFKGWAAGATACLIALIAMYSQAKPLHTYEQQSHINVSSLIY